MTKYDGLLANFDKVEDACTPSVEVLRYVEIPHASRVLSFHVAQSFHDISLKCSDYPAAGGAPPGSIAFLLAERHGRPILARWRAQTGTIHYVTTGWALRPSQIGVPALL